MDNVIQQNQNLSDVGPGVDGLVAAGAMAPAATNPVLQPPVPATTPAPSAAISPVNPAHTATSDPLLTEKALPEDLDQRWTSWRCMECKFVYEGQRPKNKCPRCGNEDPDKFD